MNSGVVFFDWGGVIADDPGDAFFLHLIESIGVEHELARVVLKTHLPELMRGYIKDDEFWEILRLKYGVSVPNDIDDRQALWPGLVPNKIMMEYVSGLRLRSVRTAILSNMIESSYTTLEAQGYFKNFETVIASCHERTAKPDKKIYEHALARVEANAQDCIFIDDKQRNIDVAASMGFRVVLAKNAQQIISELGHMVY